MKCSQRRDPVIINHAAEDEIYSFHPTPIMYGFQSYISVPILLPNGSFFGTLCAIDPKPRMLNTPEVIGMFKLFAELIAFHLDANTRLATTEATLLRQGEQAELREQFIAVLGHDLRNPLMAISAGVTMLIRRPERAAAISASIQQSVSRMAGLINNVLDFARGRLGGGLSLHRDASDALQQTLTQIIDEMRTSYPGRSVEAAFALEEPVYCDRDRLAQLFSNLLGNAMTHGAPGPASPGASQGQQRILRTLRREWWRSYSAACHGTPVPAVFSGWCERHAGWPRPRPLYRFRDRPGP